MRNLILSALILASAFQTALGQQSGDWWYSVENNQATITSYSGSGGAVTIPSEVGGYAVKQVGNAWSAVFGLDTTFVTSVVIPNSVTSIGEGAFYRCTSLTSIIIPNSVTSIGRDAFYRCTSLTSITIPNNMTSIGDGVFFECTSLTSITIPNNVTSIGNSAFAYCAGLTGTLTLPNSVTSIGHSAFAYCAGLTGTLTIPNSVTSIGSGAFWWCSGLTGTLTIPNSVTSIGTGAFAGCTLTTITMPDRFIGQVAQIGISGQVATDYLINALANNDAFVTAVANKIKATGGNYGIATQSGLSSAITTAVEPLATKTELTSSLAQSRTDGINSVLSNPNLWTLYTTSQIQNMAMGDLVLNRQENGSFVLNYEIEQSTDLQTWTTYAPLSLPLTGLPTDKAFVRIKAKQ